MSRVIHYLKKNAKNQMPHHLIVVDTETNIVKDGEFNQAQTFRLGCAIYLRWDSALNKWNEEEVELWKVEDFYKLLDRVSKGKRKIVLFAHNAAFDYTILKMDTYLSDRGFEIDMRTTDSVFIINALKKVEDGTFSITFADTMNYYKMSLKKLGKIFGEEKMFTPDFENVTDFMLMKYCKQDTRVLSELMKQHIEFIGLHDLGNFKLTIASQAFNAYRHRFMKERILVHTFDDIIDMELASYRGGRCEVFKMGKFKKVYKLDINSMYPYVMRNNLYPNISLSKKTLDISVKKVEGLIDEGVYVLGDCRIELKEPLIAVKKAKLMFPIGKIKQVLTSPEIDYILKHPEVGKVVSVDKCCTYEQKNLFKEYVDYFYALRKSTTNSAHEAMSKLFLNSLYGKFGQRSMNSLEMVEDKHIIATVCDSMDVVGTNRMDKLYGTKMAKYIRLGDTLYAIETSSNLLSHDSCPVIASTVTAYARNDLFTLMKTAGLENILYCDTDSLFVNEDGFRFMENGLSATELGKMKLEELGDCEIHGAKNYVFNNEVKLKGVKKNAVKIGENRYRQNMFITKNMKYRRGTKDGIVMVESVVKNISNNYDKGIVKEGVVYPHVFCDF